ncbi:MAG: AAA family ATPase [Phenylobacterium sp.]|nr:AAA family ATPase [Phenylobacterium sp.]
MRLTRLKVRNWRNFREAEIHLTHRAFFVGPNAAGKSNLLDAVRFLRDLVKPVGGGLSAAVRDRGDIGSLRCLQARGYRTEVQLEADVGTDEHPQLWSYHLSFTRVGKEDFVSVHEEKVLRLGEQIKELKRASSEDGRKFSQTLIQQVSANEEFRDLVEFFNSIRYLHVVPQIVRDTRRSIDREDDPYGGDLLRRINETPKRTREARLRRIQQALRIAVPQFVELKLDHDKEGRPHLSAGFKHWRPRPSFQTEEVFSDGTLRLIGFLWSVAEPAGPLLLEEPELSLHQEVALQLPAMIARMQRHSGRQVLITTHSEAITGGTGIGLSEVHRLIPGPDGTTIETAQDNEKVRQKVAAGLTVGEAVMPMARPQGVEQLSLFDLVG